MTRFPSSGLWLLCAAHFMTVLDLTVVNGALGPVGHDLGASQATLDAIAPDVDAAHRAADVRRRN